MPTSTAMLGIGIVRHRRLRPAIHAFSYPTWFVLLPLRSLRQQSAPALARNRTAWVSFHDCDHGDGGPDCLAWVDSLLRREGVDDAMGEIWLHTYPRVLGVAFKPVSFWYCHRSDGSLSAIVAEVNNTFGERHTYVLRGPLLGYGREVAVDKAFHVSPFCQIEGRYRFRFMRTSSASSAGRMVARIDYDDPTGPLLATSVSGSLTPLTAASLRCAVWRMPLLTLGVIARIHWQALRLMARRVPFFGKQATPVARANPSNPNRMT